MSTLVNQDVRVVRVALLGYGRIGQAVATLAAAEHARLAHAGVELRPVRALVRDPLKPREGPPIPLVTDAARAIGRDVDLVVEVLGGVEPARALVVSALKAGIPVVTANKTLMATHGPELRALALRHQTTLACDAAVLAGVPFLGSLSRRPLISAARRIEGIINGTSHFIVGAIEQGASFEVALAAATARGYAEPDSSADTSGRDAAEKLTILLHLAGCRDVQVGDLPRTGLEVLDPADFAGARRLGGTIKPVAFAALDPLSAGSWVGPAFVTADHPFARLNGVTNALELTDAYGRRVWFAGPGAGPEATAVTIIDDIVEAVAGGLSTSPVHTGVGPGRVHGSALREPASCPWFLSVRRTAPGAASEAERLTTCDVPIDKLVAGETQVVALTAPASCGTIRAAIAALTSGGASAVALPVLSSPRS
jgi:homoserine dehydrogenase